MPHQNKTCAIKNAVLKQHILFTVIFITNLSLANCNWMSVYVPKLDATCALFVKKINVFEAYKIEQLFCSFESCVAICFQHRYPCNSFKYTPFAKQCDLYIRNATYHSLPEDVETGQSRHFLLHSCHKEISTVPVGEIIETTSLDTDAMTANIHLPSIHRVCVVRKRPFVESYGIQRLEQITTSSLRRCLAACDAPTYSSCNSVLFSVQEETCILLARPQPYLYLGGTSPTVDSAAQFFIFVYCHNDFTVATSYAMQGFGRQPVIAYAVSNSHMQVDIHHELFYGSKAAIRLGLLDSADETECLKKCIASIATGYCDAYYFSSKENTCLTMQLKKQYTLPERLGHRSVTKFYDDETLDKAFRDESEECIMFPDHFTEMEVSLHEFREICVTKHWISSLIPNIIFSKLYVNISFLNECINICRHLKISEECKGVAYSKKMKTCMIAVGGNEHGEILLNNDQQYVTLSSCKKDRETERANNVQHVLGFIPELDETCLLELYERLDLSGWKIITRIGYTFSLQECLLKCASVMNAQKCSAVNFIDQQCVLFSRAKRASFVRSVYSVFAELLYCE